MSALSLFRNRDFRLLSAGTSATNLGDGVMMVALPWLATLLTRDPFLVGLVAMARQLPWVVLALPMGVLTDRLDHRRTLLVCDSLRVALMLAAALLAMLASPGADAVLVLAGLAFVLAAPRCCATILRKRCCRAWWRPTSWRMPTGYCGRQSRSPASSWGRPWPGC